MDKYKQLMCIKGLIMSMDEQIYRVDTVRKECQTETIYKEIADKYHKSIVEFIEIYGETT